MQWVGLPKEDITLVLLDGGGIIDGPQQSGPPLKQYYRRRAGPQQSGPPLKQYYRRRADRGKMESKEETVFTHYYSKLHTWQIEEREMLKSAQGRDIWKWRVRREDRIHLVYFGCGCCHKAGSYFSGFDLIVGILCLC